MTSTRYGTRQFEEYAPGHMRVMSAGSQTAHTPRYKSTWEEQFAHELVLQQRAGLIKAWWYEPFSLWLPGKVRYKPDFLVQHEPVAEFRKLELVEIKGWSKNRRDGITRLKIAAALFPCFTWTLVTRENGGWHETHLS